MKKILHRHYIGPLHESSSPFSALSWQELLTQLSQYMSPFSSLTVAVTIASTHYVYPRRDGQAELAWVAGYVVRVYLPEGSHPSQY